MDGPPPPDGAPGAAGALGTGVGPVSVFAVGVTGLVRAEVAVSANPSRSVNVATTRSRRLFCCGPTTNVRAVAPGIGALAAPGPAFAAVCSHWYAIPLAGTPFPSATVAVSVWPRCGVASSIVTLDGELTTTPVPLSATDWVLPATPPSLSVTTRLAVSARVAVGWNRTVIVQLAFAARVA